MLNQNMERVVEPEGFRADDRDEFREIPDGAIRGFKIIDEVADFACNYRPRVA